MTRWASRSKPDAVRAFSAMTERLGIATVPAAWPSGVAGLAQAIAVCQRCTEDKACAEWLARAPQAIVVRPAFCPNADALAVARKVKH